MYQDTVDLLESIAKAVNPTGTFYHGRVSDANDTITRFPLPQIHLYPFRVQTNIASVDVNPNILMAFLFQDSPHSDANDLLDVTNEADILQRRFRAQLVANDINFTNYEAEPFYKQFSGVCSGMFIRFNLQIKSSKVCDI